MTAGKGKHRTNVSGSATGVDTPQPEGGMVSVGERLVPIDEFNDAKRYFELFHEATSLKYPHGAYSLMYNPKSGKCNVLDCKSVVFRFDYDPTCIKNHYCSFRLFGDDMNKFLDQARSHHGVQNHTAMGLITPPSSRDFTIAYRTI